MAEIFVGAVGVRLRMHTHIPLTVAGTAYINYIKPDGTTGQWIATIEDAEAGIIYYDVILNDLDVAGVWKLNAIWDPVGDDYFPGCTACLQVKNLGDPC